MILFQNVAHIYNMYVRVRVSFYEDPCHNTVIFLQMIPTTSTDGQ